MANIDFALASVNLTTEERHVLARTSVGEFADFSGQSGERPEISANFLRQLMLGFLVDAGSQRSIVRAPGVRIKFARVVGVLDLSDCGGEGLPPLVLEDCDLPDRIDLSGSRIGRVSIDRSRFREFRGIGCEVHGDFSFWKARPVAVLGGEEEQASAHIEMRSARVHGEIWGAGALLGASSPPASDLSSPLNLQDAEITGAVVLGDGFVSRGAVRLSGAKIGRGLNCDGGSCINPGGTALSLAGAQIGVGAVFRDGFRSEGEILLVGAMIERNLDFRGASVSNPHAIAIDAMNIEIGGDVFLSESFRADGAVYISNSRIGGSLVCDGGDFRLLHVVGSHLGGDASLRHGFSATEQVSFQGARIEKDLVILSAEISNPDSTDFALVLETVRVGGQIVAQNNKINGFVSFSGAQAFRLFDDPYTAWHGAKAIFFDEFSYEQMSSLPGTRIPHWKARAALLRGNTMTPPHGGSKEFSAQPWLQAISALERGGHLTDASRLKQEFRREARRHLPAPQRVASYAYELLFGYGMSFARTFLTSMIFLMIGWIGATYQISNGILIEQDEKFSCQRLALALPYAIDVAVPLLDLRVADKCLPGGEGRLLFEAPTPFFANNQRMDTATYVSDLFRVGELMYSVLGAIFLIGPIAVIFRRSITALEKQ